MLKEILLAVVLCFSMFVISCDDINKFSKKFNNFENFAEWLNSNGHKATLVKVNKFPMIADSGDFVIDGIKFTCAQFDSKEKWERYPELIKAVADEDEKPVFKTFYNIRCFNVKDK